MNINAKIYTGPRASHTDFGMGGIGPPPIGGGPKGGDKGPMGGIGA